MRKYIQIGFLLMISYQFTLTTSFQDVRNLQANSNDLEPLSSSLTLTNGITLHYEIQGKDLILMVESTKLQGWIGIGFNPTMTNTDMVIFFANRNGKPAVKDAFSSHTVTPSFDFKEDWVLIGSQITQSGMKMKAKRALITGDLNQDSDLKQGETYRFCTAWSSSQSFVQHDEYYIYSIKLDNSLGNNSASGIDLGVSKDTLNIHKIWLFYAWGIGADIAIFVGRYLKAWKYHMLVHSLLFFVINISTIILEALVINGNDYKLNNVSKLEKNVKNHYIIGCVILALIILQHLGGIVLKLGIEGTNKNINSIKKFHLITGVIIYLLAKINLLIGTDINNVTSVNYSYSQGVIISVISIVCLFLCEIFSRFYNYKALNKVLMNESFILNNSLDNPEYQELMKMLNVEKREPAQIIAALPNLKWVIYNQGVYDISDFIHPGGQFIMKEIIGKEIGRYLLGVVPLEGYDFSPYTHSAAAINLLKNKKIGVLEYEDTNMFHVIKNENQLEDDKLKQFNNFKLIKRIQISDSIYKFDFQANCFQVKNILQGVSWIGRHYIIKDSQSSKSRLYTQLNCMTDENIRFRQNLISQAQNLLMNKTFNQIEINSMNLYSQSIPFIIKKYNFSGALSKKIHELNSEINYQIYGPLGNGLGFSELTKNQDICILCAGTGILPFLDLFDFLLKKQIQQTVHSYAKEFDPQNLNYDSYFEGCKFTVYAAFQQIDDFVGKEWITYLNQLSQKSQNNLFKLVLKLSKGKIPEYVEKLQQKDFSELIKIGIDNNSYDKIFICGPPVMLNKTIEALENNKVEKNKIVIV